MTTLIANGQTDAYIAQAYTAHPTEKISGAGRYHTSRSEAKTGILAGEADRKRFLQELYNDYVDCIYKFVFFKVGNREDAEDITSQVFIKAAHSLDVHQERNTCLAWLYQVARTTVTDHWRGFYKNNAPSLEQMEESIGCQIQFAAEPLRPGMKEDDEVTPTFQHAHSLLGKLPQNYRRVLELRFLHGCTLKETAAAMGITEGNAKVLQHRALHKAERLECAVM